MKLKEIAEKLDCKLTGDGEIIIKGVAGIREAKEGELTFVANPKYVKEIKNTKASAIILSHKGPEIEISSLRSDNPYYTFAKALELFYTPPVLKKGIHNTAVISEDSVTGHNPTILPYAVIGDNVKIGDNVIIHPHVTVYNNVIIGNNVVIHSNSVIRENTVIGDNVIIQNGAVIGGDGFSFARLDDGTQYKIVQLGRVVIEDNVEIQVNSAVDRATIGDTVIKKGVKIDNLVQVAHSCHIGENSILCGQVGLSGSTVIGNNVILAGQVGTAGHQIIGNNVHITAQSGVAGSVEENKVVSGTPAIDSSIWKKAVFAFTRLPEFSKRLKKLEKEIFKTE